MIPRSAVLLAVTSIDRLDWFSAREDGLGNLYEGLLERNAEDKKSGAGQYFTPRPLIDCMVRLTKPQPGETVRSSGTDSSPRPPFAKTEFHPPPSRRRLQAGVSKTEGGTGRRRLRG